MTDIFVDVGEDGLQEGLQLRAHLQITSNILIHNNPNIFTKDLKGPRMILKSFIGNLFADDGSLFDLNNAT